MSSESWRFDDLEKRQYLSIDLIIDHDINEICFLFMLVYFVYLVVLVVHAWLRGIYIHPYISDLHKPLQLVGRLLMGERFAALVYRGSICDFSHGKRIQHNYLCMQSVLLSWMADSLQENLPSPLTNLLRQTFNFPQYILHYCNRSL